MSKTTEIIKLADLKATVKTQTRFATSDEAIADYTVLAKAAKAKAADSPFEPLVAFRDPNDLEAATLWLADGFHRRKGLMNAGYEETAVEVRDGTKRDAIAYGFKANLEHGVRLTNEDKKHNLEMALADEEWAKLTNVALADLIGVSEGFIRANRPVAASPAKKVAVDKKTGQTREVNTTRTKGGATPKEKKGKKAKKAAAAATPEGGAPPEPEPPKADKDLEAAYVKIANALKGTAIDGPATIAAIKDGSLSMPAREVKHWAQHNEPRMQMLAPLVVTNRWSIDKANKFLDTVPTEDTKLNHLVNRVNALGGTYRDRVDGIIFIAFSADAYEVGENSKGTITITPKRA